MYTKNQYKFNLISSIIDGSPNRLREGYFIKYNKVIYDEIIDFTKNVQDIVFKFKVWHWVHDQPNYILCECGNRVSTKMNWVDGYKKFCSSKCAANSKETKELKRKTLLNKYGVDHYSKTPEYAEKVKETTMLKWGVDNYSKTQEYLEKSKKTYMEKWGVDNFTKTDLYLEKSKKTYMKNWGEEHYSKTNQAKIRFKETCRKKYGCDHIFKSDNYRIDNFGIGKNDFYISYINGVNLFKCDAGKDHNFKISTDDYFGRKKSNNKLCTVCYPISDNSSIKQIMLLDFIKSQYNGEIISGYRDVFEIDIYLPQMNFGFEFNGIYWHSDKYKDSEYHLNKTNYFLNKGIRIMHIWEDDWNYKSDIIKSQIKNVLKLNKDKIFARKCTIKEVDTKESIIFLNQNHILSKSNSVIKLGLYYKDELVSIMTLDHFEGRKKMSQNEWNINRFCNKINTNVVGGASRLLNYFIKKYKPIRIISYADKDWSLGDLYFKLGFNKINESRPDYKYVVGLKRIHKSRFRKSKLETDLTEREMMSINNIPRVWDCGKIKFELII